MHKVKVVLQYIMLMHALAHAIPIVSNASDNQTIMKVISNHLLLPCVETTYSAATHLIESLKSLFYLLLLMRL